MRGDWLQDLSGECERLLRGPEGVPPRRSAPMAAVGSVLGMCMPGSSSVACWGGSKSGKGSKEGSGACLTPSGKPLASASLRLSGEGSTWRIVERVLNAVPGRSGETGAVRGRMYVARMLTLSSAGVDDSGSDSGIEDAGSADGCTACDTLEHGGKGDSTI